MIPERKQMHMTIYEEFEKIGEYTAMALSKKKAEVCFTEKHLDCADIMKIVNYIHTPESHCIHPKKSRNKCSSALFTFTGSELIGSA